jgi:hypothetical protein
MHLSAVISTMASNAETASTFGCHQKHSKLCGYLYLTKLSITQTIKKCEMCGWTCTGEDVKEVSMA